MDVIYIAGPYRGKNVWEVERNIRAAENLAFKVAEAGFVPLCPHAMFRFYDGTLTDDYWLEATQELLRRCDAALFLSTWIHSAGSKGERAEALRKGIRVFDSLQELKDVLGGGHYPQLVAKRHDATTAPGTAECYLCKGSGRRTEYVEEKYMIPCARCKGTGRITVNKEARET